MKIHVLCPLYRKHLVPTLIHYLEPMGIEWYPIMAPSDMVTFDSSLKWIHSVHVRELLPKAQCCQKFNDFLTQHIPIDNDYYAFMCDDNMYEPGFFDVIRQQSAKILIYSLYRGDTTPKEPATAPHGTNTLKVTHHKDIRPGKIDYAQFIIKGELFKTQLFNPYIGCTDGRYIQELAAAHPSEVKFLPDLYAFFNYFQPGRYTKKEKFIKTTWELPKII